MITGFRRLGAPFAADAFDVTPDVITLAKALTTPGPLIMVVQFVGFLAAFRDPGGLDPWLAGVLARCW